MTEVKIRQVHPEDLEDLWKIAFSDPDAAWTKYDGPYFNDELPTQEEFLNVLAYKNWINNKDRLAITYDDQIVGSVSDHFEDGALKRWLDMGITIYTENLWNKNIGGTALKKFISYLFENYDLPHLGLTTWSGNPRMMHVAEKIGMQQESCVRQVRFYNGKYYDSMKYGILRDEWQ